MGFFSYLSGFLFPGRCVICGAGTEYDSMAPVVPGGWPEETLSWMECAGCDPFGPGRSIGAKVICSRCLFSLEYVSGVAAVGGFPEGNSSQADVVSPFLINDALLELVHAFKFRGNKAVGPFLSWWMSLELERYIDERSILSESAVLLPVPLHPSRRRERGYNQAEILAGCISERLGIPLAVDAVSRRRKTRRQSDLSDEERAANVIGAFELSCPASVEGRFVLLVDDLVTTGATAASCMTALSGAEPGGIAVVCAGRSMKLRGLR